MRTRDDSDMFCSSEDSYFYVYCQQTGDLMHYARGSSTTTSNGSFEEGASKVTVDNQLQVAEVIESGQVKLVALPTHVEIIDGGSKIRCTLPWGRWR